MLANSQLVQYSSVQVYDVTLSQFSSFQYLASYVAS